MIHQASHTKFTLPRRRVDLLSRTRLLAILDDLLYHRLIIVSAPAGYGKTSVLVDLAHHTNMPVCWFSIDPVDRDIHRFISNLISAIAERYPAIGQRSSLAIQQALQSDVDIDQLVSILVNDVYECIQEHFIIVLDDYHFIDDQPEINQFLGSFIQAVDENCHFAVSSRTLLSLPDLALMVARSQVGGIGYEELIFTPVEIKALISQNYQFEINDQLAEELARESEGWITGLLLSSQSRWQGMTDRLRTARVSSVGLHDYLARQVLDQQTPAVRDFLLKTSMLEEFDADLCQTIFGEPQYSSGETWVELIEQTLHNNLLVLPVGESGSWIRYHHLFRDFLQNRLLQESPQQAQVIRERLANVCAQQGDWDKAYALFARLGNNTEITNLIERAGPSLIKTGRVKTLMHWIDSLPASEVPENPVLLSLKGGGAVMQGDVEHALTFLNYADQSLRENKNFVELARNLTRRAHAHQYLGNYQAALADAEEALQICADRSALAPVRAMALRSRGLNRYRLGFWEIAITDLKSAAGIYDMLGSVEELALVNIDLGTIYQSQGQYRLARSAYEAARTSLLKTGDLHRLATVLNNLGVLNHVQGQYEQGARLFEQALHTAQQCGSLRLECTILASIGDLYRDLNALRAAELAYQRADEIALRIEDRFLIDYLSLACTLLAYQQGDLRQVQTFLTHVAQPSEKPVSKYQQALTLLEAGRLLLLLGKDLSQALQYLEKASTQFSLANNKIEAARCYLYLAATYQAANQPEMADTSLSTAFDISTGLESMVSLVVTARDLKSFLEASIEKSGAALQIRELLKQVTSFESELTTLRRKLRQIRPSVPFAPAHLTIHTLGRLKVLQDNKIVRDFGLNSQDARELFCLLLTNPKGMTKEDISSVLWPESTPEQAKLQFKNSIYRIRRSLDQEVIVLNDDIYKFNTHIDYEFDVEMFEYWIRQAQSAADTQQELLSLQHAIELFQGSYLLDISSAWVLPLRSFLNQEFISGGLRLAELYMNNEAYEPALATVERLLHQDACLEEAYRIAMRIYAKMGQKADIVRLYERCERSLRQEVRLSPSPQTFELFHDLIQ